MDLYPEREPLRLLTMGSGALVLDSPVWFQLVWLTVVTIALINLWVVERLRNPPASPTTRERV